MRGILEGNLLIRKWKSTLNTMLFARCKQSIFSGTVSNWIKYKIKEK